jgi:tetratricopeptide (TPR) repeat protein
MGSVGESDEILRRKSSSYTNRGNLFFNRGNLDSALTSYQSSLAIDKRLIARDPANTQWQRDLTISYDNIGNVQRAQGDLQAALSSYQQSLQIREKLAARDPANTQWQTDLVVSLYKIATVLEKQNPPQKKEATTHYKRILNILRPLAAANRLTADQKGWITDAEKRLDALQK